MAIEFVSTETNRAVKTDPRDPLLIMLAISIFQSYNISSEVLAEMKPIFQRLVQLAPQWVDTIQILANHELLKGNYQEVIRLVEDYKAMAPTEQYFDNLKQSALDALESADRNDQK